MLLLSATIIDKPLYFIPFGIVLKLYKTIQEGIDWMSQVIDNKTSNPLLPIHKILFNEYASRMRIDETVGVFKDNKILFEGIQMKNYYQIEEKYDKLTMILEQSKKNKKRQDKKELMDKELKDKQNKEKKKREENKYKNDSDSDSDNDFIDINKKVNNDELDYEDCEDYEDLYDPGDVSDDVNLDKKKDVGIGKIQRIRQEIELLRVDTIYELTLKYLLDGKSVAIFVNFTKTIEELSKRLRTKCIIWGAQTLKERSKSIDDFCSDKSRVIICNIQSGGQGISLHDTNGIFPRVSIISPTWSAQDLIQVLGRIHRAMGKSDCVQQIIF